MVLRDYFRLWLVFSAFFVVVTANAFFGDVKSLFEKAAVESLVPMQCSDARGKIGDYEVKGYGGKNFCWYKVQEFKVLYPEYKDLTDDQLSHRLYEKVGI